jgi:cholesterol oxidase
MHATVTIDDLDRFVADSTHLGRLSGRISYPLFGDDIVADTGVFNLFSPASEPGLKYMVYELGFTLDGQPHYLAGKKRVRDEPGFDLWKDTTTLFTRLHQGPDASGTVIGAGILTLGAADLASLVSTMRVLGELHEAPGALAQFGRFFLGELWDSYARLANR